MKLMIIYFPNNIVNYKKYIKFLLFKKEHKFICILIAEKINEFNFLVKMIILLKVIS